MTFVRCVTANELGYLVDEDEFIWRKKTCSIELLDRELLRLFLLLCQQIGFQCCHTM